MRRVKARLRLGHYAFPICLVWILTGLSSIKSVVAYSGTEFNFYANYAQKSPAARLDFDENATVEKQRETLIRKEILQMLGLHHAPKPLKDSKHNSAPKFMLELYKQLELNDMDEGYSTPRNHDVIKYNITSLMLGNQAGDADMIVSFINRETDAIYTPVNSTVLSFESKEIPDVEQVTLAEVRVFKNAESISSGTGVFTLQIDWIRARQADGPSITEPVMKIEVTSDFQGWLDLNVTSAVAYWLALSTNDLQFLLTVRNGEGNVITPAEAGITTAKTIEETKPFLVAFFKAIPAKTQLRQRRDVTQFRQRRDVSQQTRAREPRQHKNRRRYNSPQFITQRSRSEASCHRETFFVRFRDLDWEDWVIAPDGYPAFYCTGRCTFPLNARMNATNHAIVQTLVALMRPRNVPLPCCAPTKLNPISVLYLDDQSNVILRKFQNMVAIACGCH